jgi:alkylation response protein AidB-like acyl-CoA dehydrogenase
VIVPKIPHTKRDIFALKKIASQKERDGMPLIQDSAFRGRISQLEIELASLEFLVLHMLHAAEDDPVLDVLGPVVKIRGADLRQRVSELMMEAVGERGLAMPSDPTGNHGRDQSSDQIPDVASSYLWRRSATIAGGTTEVQRNLIAAIALKM